ncbi:MAG TPA: PQQ-dependent sugar dehydrogenase [Gammaproteobacteria bacterium]|nr:PQQ-dependent sugar dehydrogenase [Gammaproteobacteria bacterium]
MNIGKPTLLAAMIGGLTACGSDQSGPDTAAPQAEGQPRAAVAGITLPEGFTATIFADNLDRPRHIAVRDNGDVYVALRSGRQQVAPEDREGGVTALRDTNGDGRADIIERFGRGDVDTGLAIHDGYVYFSSAVAVYAVPLTNELAPSAEPELVVGGFQDSGGGHTAKPMTFDGEGHLYVQAGSPSNSCQTQNRTPGSPGLNPCPQLEHFGGVWRFVASGRNQDHLGDGIQYSTGHRNVVALEWNPLANQLFLVMHGRDQLDTLWPEYFSAQQRSELPAEEFHAVRQGDNLGWPYTYYDQQRGERMVSPEYGGDGETPAQAGRYKDPLIGFPGHWAPNDLIFYTGTQFPERYRGGAFVAFHGSWNREVQDGYNVVFVPMNGAEVAGDWEIFADDFEGRRPITSPADAARRPSGLAQGPDGSLYISDDVGGRIWKVSYTGT